MLLVRVMLCAERGKRFLEKAVLERVWQEDLRRSLRPVFREMVPMRTIQNRLLLPPLIPPVMQPSELERVS